MTSEEKRAWIFGPVSVLSYLGYLAAVTIAGAGYAPAMLWSIGIAIVVNIVLHIAVTIRSPREPRDERDRAIGHFGDAIGNSTVVAGAVAALLLALAEVRYEWIANVILLGFVLSAVLASTAKIAAYRYGLPREHAW
ncbi:hypothetical protein HH310_18535 [Actinoplanes sp. TBRC 11911]|uniref:hypothetical protein n=1 Tax=Actinoplanes sp. TBRC 11911 TaxID=2729386 RepID=UPI00145EB9B9|nr:hypothetical protein [Actinoplanes sp. TBRC 11911]NMO53182.1 hypothetical protein [Actinoplanes sp. TBRC 11911]